MPSLAPTFTGLTVSRPPGTNSSHNVAVAPNFDALMDWHEVTNISISMPCSSTPSIAQANQHFNVSFVGLSDSGYNPGTLSVSGGAGTLPSAIRAGTLVRETLNNDGFYTSDNTFGTATITVTYNDYGLPGMIQFSL